MGITMQGRVRMYLKKIVDNTASCRMTSKGIYETDAEKWQFFNERFIKTIASDLFCQFIFNKDFDELSAVYRFRLVVEKEIEPCSAK